MSPEAEKFKIPTTLMSRVRNYCLEYELETEETIRKFIALGFVIAKYEEKDNTIGLKTFIHDADEPPKKIILFQDESWHTPTNYDTEPAFEEFLLMVPEYVTRRGYPISDRHNKSLAETITEMIGLGLDLSIHIDNGEKIFTVLDEELRRLYIFPHQS